MNLKRTSQKESDGLTVAVLVSAFIKNGTEGLRSNLLGRAKIKESRQ